MEDVGRGSGPGPGTRCSVCPAIGGWKGHQGADGRMVGLAQLTVITPITIELN